MYYITTYYKFIPVASVETTKAFFNEIAEKYNIKGLIILAKEGFNSTVSADNQDNLELYKKALLTEFKLEKLNFKP